MQNTIPTRDWTIIRWDTYKRSMRFFDDGVDLDVNWDSFKFFLYKYETSQTAILTKEVVVHQPWINSVIFTLATSETQWLQFDEYFYKIKWYKADGSIRTILQWDLEVK